MLNRTIFFFVAVVLAIIVGFAGALVARDTLVSSLFGLVALVAVSLFFWWVLSDDGREHYRDTTSQPNEKRTPLNTLSRSQYERLLVPSEHSPLPDDHPDKLHIIEIGSIRVAGRRPTMPTRLAAAGIIIINDDEYEKLFWNRTWIEIPE